MRLEGEPPERRSAAIDHEPKRAALMVPVVIDTHKAFGSDVDTFDREDAERLFLTEQNKIPVASATGKVGKHTIFQATG